MTWAILSVGFFLCLLGGTILRQVLRLRASYMQSLRQEGVGTVPMLPAQVVMLVGWGAVFLTGCALIGWGWVR